MWYGKKWEGNERERMECDTCIGEFFTKFLDENKIPYMVIGMIPLSFIKRSCNYLADDIYMVSIWYIIVNGTEYCVESADSKTDKDYWYK